MRLIDDEHLDESVSIESLATDLIPDFAAIAEAERTNAQKREERGKIKDSENDVKTIFSFDSFLAN